MRSACAPARAPAFPADRRGRPTERGRSRTYGVRGITLRTETQTPAVAEQGGCLVGLLCTLGAALLAADGSAVLEEVLEGQSQRVPNAVVSFIGTQDPWGQGFGPEQRQDGLAYASIIQNNDWTERAEGKRGEETGHGA